MIILKYTRTGIFGYLSFLDIRNAFKRTFNRAKIQTKMSQGFNPHELMYFNDPDSLGIQSNADYALIDTDLTPSELMQKFNDHAPQGLKIVECALSQQKINFNKIFDCAMYSLEFDETINQKEMLELFATDSILCEKQSKDTKKIIDIKSKIFDVKIKNNTTIELLLAYGQEKLNPYLVVDYICNKLSLDKHKVNIKKENVYHKESENIINVDLIFFN